MYPDISFTSFKIWRKPLLAIVGLMISQHVGLGQASLTGTDGAGQTSFNAAGRWSDGAAPSSAKDYLVNGFYLRTPENNTASAAFGGRSLTISGGGALLLKNTADVSVSVNGLTLDNGYISHFGQGNSTATLTGDLTVESGGAHLYAANGSLWINSSTVLNGDARVWGSLNPALGVQTFGTMVFNEGGRLLLSATTNVNNSIADVNFTQAFSSTYLFRISDLTTDPFIVGEGTLGRIDANFGGRFQFDLSSLSYGIGDSWQILDPSTIGGVFAYSGSFNVDGFSNLGSGIWESSNGQLQFDQGTGYLSVVAIPEPSAALVLLAGISVIGLSYSMRTKSQ